MADNLYSKQFRLLSASDFANLKTDSRIFKKSLLRIYYKENNLDFSRIGISVSTKVGNSVLRHRLKRLLVEEFRKSNFKYSGLDFLCVVQTFKKDSLLSDVEKSILKSFNEFISRNSNV